MASLLGEIGDGKDGARDHGENCFLKERRRLAAPMRGETGAGMEIGEGTCIWRTAGRGGCLPRGYLA
ncbi:hypothetical protein GmRootA79_18610 [Acidovorax sp. A79]